MFECFLDEINGEDWNTIELLFESMNDVRSDNVVYVRLANIAIHCLTAVPQSAHLTCQVTIMGRSTVGHK